MVGHSDVAPTRKDDPGELFPWNALADAGLAARVPGRGVDPGWTDAGAMAAMTRYGYGVDDAKASLTAFQRHFRPARVDGLWDAETRAVLLALLRAEGR